MRRTEEALHFSVENLRSGGKWLRAGVMSWGDRASVGFRVIEYCDEAEVFLDYTVNGVPVQQKIPSLTTRQRVGRRWWLLCPGCSRRMGVLYLPPGAKEFRCRHCYGLRYESQEHDQDFLLFPIMAATGAPKRIARRALREALRPDLPL